MQISRCSKVEDLEGAEWCEISRYSKVENLVGESRMVRRLLHSFPISLEFCYFIANSDHHEDITFDYCHIMSGLIITGNSDQHELSEKPINPVQRWAIEL